MANKAYPELAAALATMVGNISQVLRANGYTGAPIKMFLAGGMAINYWCGTRYTADVDASFSRRVILPGDDLIVQYTKANGQKAHIYFDTTYNPTLALMHEDYEDNAVPWPEVAAPNQLVRLYVLSPLDLALSKVARFTEQDREDIKALAHEGLVLASEFRERATDALGAYVGNLAPVKTTIDMVSKDLAAIEAAKRQELHPRLAPTKSKPKDYGPTR
jgi:hypothetical protein